MCTYGGKSTSKCNLSIKSPVRSAPHQHTHKYTHMTENDVHMAWQGNVDEAGKELEKAIRLDPSNPLPFINKARGSCTSMRVCELEASDRRRWWKRHSNKAFKSTTTNSYNHATPQALIAWQAQDTKTARETLQHVIEVGKG